MRKFTLLSFQWKAAVRSATVSKSFGIKIIMGFVFLMLFLQLLGGGIYVGSNLAENSENPIADLSGYGIYFFLAILMCRYMLQKLPTLIIKPYLTLPIKKSKLVNYVLTKPLFNSLNILPLCFILAILIGLKEQISSHNFWLIISCTIIGDLFFNYLSIYIKRVQIKYEYVFYIFLATIASLLFLDKFSIINLQTISVQVFTQVINQSFWLLPGILLLVVAYFLNFQFLYKHFSLEDFGKGDSNQISSLENLSYLDKYGKVGTFALLELKMFMRNKRTRTLLLMAPLFLLYGVFFYTNPNYLKMNVMLIFVGIFISGGFMMSFGLYFFAWESSHFDIMLTANNTFEDYIKAKYFLMLAASTIIYLLSIFYIVYGVDIIMINTACFLFNIGVNSQLLLYFATNNRQYMDLTKGSAFNYQGIGARHFVLMIPLLLLPILTYLPFGLMGHANLGTGFIGIIGILGLLFREKLMDVITQRFLKKRYQMSEGFRNK